MDEYKAMLHEAWRAGAALPGGLLVPCQSPADAAKLRFALYNSVKALKHGESVGDEKLLEAVKECQVTVSGAEVRISRKAEDRAMQALGAALGQVPRRDGEALAMEESLKRLEQKFEEGAGEGEAPAAPARSTPFYTREG